MVVPGDQASYGAFNDWGHWSGNAWAGYTNLPTGYWVYDAPNWYIWGQVTKVQPAAPGQVRKLLRG